MDASATPPPAVEGSGDRINARTSEGEAQVAQEFLTVIDKSVEDCHGEVTVVLESQQELQKSLHRLGGEVQKIFQRLPRADITKRTSKIPVLRRRCQRLGTKVQEIQERLSRIALIAETLPSEQSS